jgi:outer membrane protein assembly factor BamB
MNSGRNRTLATFAICAIAVGALVAGDAADWPQFRGPHRDGISAEKGLLTGWPDGGPQTVWRIKLGQGFSGISIVGGRVYTMFGDGSDEFAICLDAATGKEIWRHRTDAIFKDNFGNGPRSTPTVDGETVYTLGARGRLHALGVADGGVLWSKDLVKEYGAKIPTWGVSTSPLVEGNLLIVNVGGKKGASIVAFDKKSGKEAWRSLPDQAGYAAPIAITVGKQRQVLVLTGEGLVAVAPGDGKLIWRHPWKTSYDVNAATPVFIPPDRIFLSTGYDVGAAMLQIQADGNVTQLWKNREMRNKFSSSLLHDGNIYGFDEKALKCVDPTTGETRWQERGLGHGSLIYADGHLIVLGDAGTLVLVEAKPGAYREKGRAQVFDGKTWTMPTLAGGKLFLRDENELISLDVSG